MAELTHLRETAREIFNHALLSVDPRLAVRAAISLADQKIRIGDSDFPTTSVYVVAIGKAAISMALGCDDVLGDRITEGVVTCPRAGTAQNLSARRWNTFAGGHPLPNEASLSAARAAFNLLDRANHESSLVVFLISGGGSALIEWPSDENITLSDLRETNRILISCGATINEINTVRRAFSAVKGGRLAGRALNARQVTLIVSDTNPGDEASVASGPTLLSAKNTSEPLDVVSKYRLETTLPASVFRAIKQSKPPDPIGEHPYYVLLNNGTAVDAAASKAIAMGFAVGVPNGVNEQPIDEGCELLLSRLRSLTGPATEGVRCLVSGGEFSCPVRGNGRGGRNLETVLRCAIEVDGNTEWSGHHTVVLSAGTDGIDGNSAAAGAIGDESTVARARSLGLDAQTFLDRSDSGGFFEKLGDAIVTGPTGTNVRDIRILLSQ